LQKEMPPKRSKRRAQKEDVLPQPLKRCPKPNIWNTPETYGHNAYVYVKEIKSSCGIAQDAGAGFLILEYYFGADGMDNVVNAKPGFRPGSPVWFTQWFEDRNHFHSLMKIEGLQLMSGNQIFHAKELRDVTEHNAIWNLFAATVARRTAAQKVNIDTYVLTCRLLHKEVRKGGPYFQCPACDATFPPQVRKSRQELWLIFVEEHFELIFEYLKQLAPCFQNQLARSLDESWLEGRKMFVR
jgi:hypothetical protein